MAKKSLRDMMNDKRRNTGQQNNIDVDQMKKKLSPKEQEQLNRMKKNVGKYQNYSEEQLMNEIRNMRSSNPGVKNIDDKKLNDFKDFLSPMLDNQQKQRLNSIINQLKKN